MQIGELVFDNLYPEGIPYAEWINDIGIDEIEELDLQEQALGSSGCLDSLR